MLIPESGDSTIMNNATQQPAKIPVNLASLRWFDVVSTMRRRKKDIVASPAKAARTPFFPGRVAT
jgi:hypothetical protein